MYSLDRSQRVEAAPRIVFAFFSDPRNLAAITPPGLGFRIHGRFPAELGAGSRIEYRIRWTGLRLRWVTRITRWEPDREFEDVQEAGPYAVWIHSHRFRPDGRGVVMDDHVDYALPFGFVGRLAHRLRVRRQLEDIFEYRRAAIARLFPTAGAS